MCCKKSFSRTPPRYTNTLEAEKSLSMPSLPNTATPCDHDWKTDMIGIPREPKCEYRSGRSRHRQTFAALVEDPDERRPHAAAGAHVGEVRGRLEGRCGEGGDEGAGGAGALLGEAVERPGAAHELGRIELGAVVLGAARVHPVGDAAVLQARRHLLRRGVDAAASLVRRLDRPEHAVGLHPVAALAEQPHRLLLVRVGEPGEHLRDGAAACRGCQQHAGEQVHAGAVEERIRLGVRRPGSRREILRELCCAGVVGDVGERVPPPGRLLAGDLLRVEHPHRALLRADVARRVQHVALVRRRDDGAGRGDEPGDHQRRRLADPRAGDHGRHVLERRVQHPSAHDGAAQRDARAADHAEPLRLLERLLLLHVGERLERCHVPRGVVDGGAPLPTEGAEPEEVGH